MQRISARGRHADRHLMYGPSTKRITLGKGLSGGKGGRPGRNAMTLARRQFLRLAALGAAASTLASIARAQTYPTRPVTIVVPFIAGGGTDLLARLTAQKLASRLGKPFLVENKPGASTTLAAMSVVRAAPDG